MFRLYSQAQEKMDVFKATKDSYLDIFGFISNFARIITVLENANEISKCFE